MQKLCGVAFILTLVVVVLGAWTRLTDAGLGCPDWPGCYGFNYVPATPGEHALAAERFPDAPLEVTKARNEMIHRYAAGTLGLTILLMAVGSLRRAHRHYRAPAWLLLAMVTGQATLGMLTVTLNLLPFVVMGHLLGGFSILALLFWLLCRGQRSAQRHSLDRSLAPWFWAALLALVVQIALGGWTAANYAAMACTELPVCQGDWVGQWQWSAFHPHGMPAETYQYGVLSQAERATIHAAHRLWAMVTVVLLLVLAWRLLRQPGLRNWGVMLAIMVMVQLMLGVANVVLHLPLWVAVAHNGGAAVLLLILTGTGTRLWRGREAKWHEASYCPPTGPWSGGITSR
ncbi:MULTISPECIES: COX15/CtaA family protein [Oceanimonas]|uniref:Heme A synthase n=1 Tax=Oceanimonas doudoroffii TaxID=84158 RepID=A0A233RDM8_9GAMM|nr:MULTISPECIES: COX15/CtaA family protein [Oceanimonas]NHH99040.1 Heme A synthase [Oceanimonas sp. MB9]OXY81501.1 heme A synthase [Oceanimonas doudoroffii]